MEDRLVIQKFYRGVPVIALENLTREHARQILENELEGVTPEGLDILLLGNIHIPLDAEPFTLVVRKDASCFAH